MWTNVGGVETVRPMVPGTEDLQALAFVQEVQVKLGLAGLPQISVQMSPTFEDGMKFLDSPLADGRRQNRVEVQLGYAGGTGDAGPVLSTPYIATLEAPEVTIDMDVQIVLKGTGLGVGAQHQGGRVVGRKNENREDIIRRLASGTGGRRTLEVDFSEALRDAESSRLLKESAESYAQGGRTDWLALWELAEITHCVMNIMGPAEGGSASRLLWMPRRGEHFTGPPTRVYRLYHLSGGQLSGETTITSFQKGGSSELPILSFSCNTEAVWNALTYQDVLGQGANLSDVATDSVEASSVTVTVEGQAAPVDSGEGAQTIPGTDELPETPLPIPGATDNPEAVRQAGNEVEAGGAMCVQCEIETLGDPAVLPGDVVALAGLGRRFDSRVYHVWEVTHSIGVGGYSTNILVRSNIDPASAGNDTTGQPNTSKFQAATAEFVADTNTLSDADLDDITGIQL